MRSRTDARRAIGALLICGVLSIAPTLDARAAQPATPSAEEITRALDVVKADPNLAAERTMKLLRWKTAGQRQARRMPAWLTWILGLFRWLDQSARLLLWASAAMLAGMLVVYILRIVRARQAEAAGVEFTAPTHVRDLDIRPETLPDDIGAAARALWDEGAHRASLALLYRGLLSRLAHVHRLPIRDSTTEGDCLTLAGTHLADARRAYTAQLVRVWQRAVYGGQPAATSAVYVLCDGFAAALDAPSSRPSAGASS